MDTGEFFQNVARRNYFEFFERGDDIRLLWNAVVSMNSVAEYLALHQQNYARISQNQLTRTAKQIREQHHLLDLKYCAETFKHIRKIGVEKTWLPGPDFEPATNRLTGGRMAIAGNTTGGPKAAKNCRLAEFPCCCFSRF